jgi:hypothetical protein
MQTETASIYSELETIVMPYLLNFKEDLTRHDKKTLSEYSGPFIYGYRPTGTNLFKLQPEETVKTYFSEQYIKHKVNFSRSKERLFDQFRKAMLSEIIWITQENKMFLFFDGNKLIRKTKEQITLLWERHINKVIERLAALNEDSETIVRM